MLLSFRRGVIEKAETTAPSVIWRGLLFLGHPAPFSPPLSAPSSSTPSASRTPSWPPAPSMSWPWFPSSAPWTELPLCWNDAGEVHVEMEHPGLIRPTEPALYRVFVPLDVPAPGHRIRQAITRVDAWMKPAAPSHSLKVMKFHRLLAMNRAISKPPLTNGNRTAEATLGAMATAGRP